MVSEGVHPAGTGLPWHEHDGPTICFVLRGAFLEGYRGHSLECTPGTLKITPAGDPHYNRFDRGDTQGLLIEVSPERVGALRPHAAVLDERVHLRGGVPAALALRVRQELHMPDESAPLVVEGLLLELIASVARGAAGGAADVESVRGGHSMPLWVREARDVLHARTRDGVRLADLAELAGVHPITLTRAFHRAFGCTVGEYLRRLRLERAIERLGTTDLPLAQIALEAGFADQSHFSHLFRQRTGMSPSSYRRLLRGGAPPPAGNGSP